MSPKEMKDKAAQNIQVFLRVRPLTDSEIKGGSCVKSLSGDKSINVRGKVYGPFDRVFTETSTQKSVYEQVARQGVNLVLKGYNSTIFAYGQTGTGKTYAMEGSADKAYSGDWKNDPNLGIIPRAVEHIFDSLRNGAEEEFCVRVSYLELYNEELFDLIAPNDENRQRLRLFEDPLKKGSTIISGVEEVPVQSKEEVFKLLRRGAELKQMASTKVNNRSSRSHCVFIINVVIRETTLEGQELVRQGRLNLVDLAGSESIGRSGATGIRAKEAGNINQSLLTLGRCITALTTNAGHIPYRESKLTRLLQDSLGGATVTTIISTISPSNQCFEETISTLEYSSRAKNIQNHPEANEKLCRKDMLREMAKSIEKLQRDLRTAREKNGIFISQESLKDMEEEIEAHRKQIEELEGQLTSTVNKWQLLVEDMALMDEQYQRLYERKVKVEDRLALRVNEVETTRKELCDAQTRAESLEKSLQTMHEVALNLRFQAQQLQLSATCSSMDLESIWEKLAEVMTLAEKNLCVCNELVGKLKSETSKMSQESAEYFAFSDTFIQKILSEIALHEKKVNSTLETAENNVKKLCYDVSTTCERINQELEGVSGATKTFLDEQKKTADTNLEEIHKITTLQTQNLQKFLSSTNNFCEERRVEHEMFRERILNLFDEETSNMNADQTETLRFQKEQYDLINSLKAGLERYIKSNSLLREKRKGILDTERAVVEAENQSFITKTAESQNTLEQHKLEREADIDLMALVVEKAHKLNSDFNEKTKSNIMSSMKTVLGEKTLIEGHGEEIKQEMQNSTIQIYELLSENGQSLQALINNESSVAASAKKTISDACASIDTYSKKFLGQDLQKLKASGRTPVKRKYDVIEEIDEVPKIEGLLKETGYHASARKSVYRVRDSILDSQENVMSPQTISTTRKAVLMISIGEESETNPSNNIENITPV